MKNVYINHSPCIRKNADTYLKTNDDCLKNVSGQIVIITFTNLAKAIDAENTAQTVYHEGDPLCHQDSYFCKSTGDEEGDLLGVISKTIQGKAEFLTWSSNVFIEGKAAVRHGDQMVSNNKNTRPAPLLVSNHTHPLSNYKE